MLLGRMRSGKGCKFGIYVCFELEDEIEGKASQVLKIEGKMESLQMKLRKLEREKTDSDIQR